MLKMIYDYKIILLFCWTSIFLNSCEFKKADDVHICYFVRVLSYCNSVGIHKGTNCAPLLTDLFLYTIEAETCTLKKQSLVVAFKSKLRYYDNSLPFNNCYFQADVDTLYPGELEKRDTAGSTSFVLYLDMLLGKYIIDNLTAKLHDFNLSIVSCSYLCSNIPQLPAYGVFVFQFIRYARAYSTFEHFLNDAGYWQTSW